MFLPESVQTCIRMLKEAGFRAYAVGGCVRDALLGQTPHDYDLCTDATPDAICRVFSGYSLIRQGEKHGTIGVVMDGEVYEITTFRTEGGYADRRHPQWVKFVPTVEEDLSRRDFTINAMAYTPAEGYIDPFGGRQDLEDRILRAVGDPYTRFSEDALRILRGVRFAARFRLTPETDTFQAMESLASTMDKLAVERIFSELCQLLLQVTAQDLLRFRHILTAVLPELADTIDFDQHSPHHAYDVFTHTAHVVQAVPPVLSLRWAALLHDLGKPRCFYQDENGRGHFPGHAGESARMADVLLTRLKAPTALREQVVMLIEKHMMPLQPEKKLVRRWLGRMGTSALQELLTLQEADLHSKGLEHPEESDQFHILRNLIDELLEAEDCLSLRDLAVNGTDLIQAGFPPGPVIGKLLQHLLEQVQEETLPNTKQALLDACKEDFL